MKFSIAIPAYKERFLADAIQSVLNQSYSNFELIIVDDCSPENLEHVVSSFSDSRIRFYRNEKNCGAINVVDNWNICLSYCTGDFIICMGDDDLLLPECLEEYYKLIIKYPDVDVLHGQTLLIDSNNNVCDAQLNRAEWESFWSLWWHRWNGRTLQYIGDFCFRTDPLKNFGGFFKLPLAWASDDITAVRAAKSHGIVNTSKFVFQYRVSEVTISNSAPQREKIKAINDECDWYRSVLSENTTNSSDEIYKQLICRKLDIYQNRKIVTYLAKDMANNKLRFFYWFTNKNKYGLTYCHIMKAFLASFKWL